MSHWKASETFEAYCQRHLNCAQDEVKLFEMLLRVGPFIQDLPEVGDWHALLDAVSHVTHAEAEERLRKYMQEWPERQDEFEALLK